MVAVTAQQMCQATGGTLYGDGALVVTELSTDSRSAENGVWFIPIKGERFDGHDYIDMALERGASGCFCARLPEKLREDKTYILVEDTKRAMKDLASWYRDQFKIPIVQITGSVGKTTTKEMIASVLSQGLRTHKTKGNLNGDIGAPLMVLGITHEHQVAVIETGMDNFGQIRYLGEMIRPDFAVISNIGVAHMEYLGSREGILRAKCEIFENLRPGGVAVLNGNDELLNTLTLPFETLRCGMGEECDVLVEDVRDLGVAGVSCTVRTKEHTYALEIPVPGVHMVYSAAMAAVIGERLGLREEQICRGVRCFEQTGERMRVERLKGGRILLNDSYNANPQSMGAALKILAKTDAVRRIAMLGDMKELGDATASGHSEMGHLVGELGIDTLIAVGAYCKEYMVPAAQAAGCQDVRWYEDKTQAYSELLEEYVEGAAVLL
ncbi:MAG: UDP-N-acetylmuramoyl-tripeptide--D-alanyl-D-alanine ligase, partial [Oscillospiraceae bacterium]|nr:UDP-N-acetylmuramoyl-tripeptide--D-alanyl-D-alanine ligase [Oscillospiraceae bacterium]